MWGLSDSTACECGEPEQTAAHIINSCPLHRPPSEAGLFEVGPLMRARLHHTESVYNMIWLYVWYFFISETKLGSTFTQAQFDAPGYNYYRKDRNCHGGGILAYIRSDLPARRHPDLEISRIESVIIEITIHSRKWTIICAYCPPPSMNNSIFIDDFTPGVDILHIHFDNVIVVGDLNYDVNIPLKCQPLQLV